MSNMTASQATKFLEEYYNIKLYNYQKFILKCYGGIRMPRYIDVERFCEENPDFDSAVYVALSKAPTIYEKSVKKIDLMDAVDDMSSWICVNDSIPKRFESVLCYYPDKDYGSKSMVDHNQCDEGETPYFSNQCLWGRCTHWMPLPVTPKGDDNATN